MSHAPDSPEELPNAPDDGEKLSIRTIAGRLNQRSQVLETASNEAPEDGQRKPTRAVPSPAPPTPNDAGPLLGLEPPAVEKAGENRACRPGPANPVCYAPLLGTIFPARFVAGTRTPNRRPTIMPLSAGNNPCHAASDEEGRL